MHGKVEVWYMTEEERQAYIKKHPIVTTKKGVTCGIKRKKLAKKQETSLEKS